MSQRRVILVTGAPRSATTPVGNVLASTHQTVSLYEPLGPTGLKRISNRFPMIDAESGLTPEGLAQIVDDFGKLRSGGLNSQQRGTKFSLSRMIFGSRTLHSFRIATLQPWSRHVIWKDPHAMMLVPEAVDLGLDVVVTARRALAHAASFQRLGWVSQAKAIYPRWAKKYGPCPLCEEALPETDDAVLSGAVLWRMCYLPLVRTGTIEKVHLVTSDQLIEDETVTYTALLDKLGLQPTAKTEKLLNRAQTATARQPKQNVTHDWNRSASAANSYWKDILTSEQVTRVSDLTVDVETALYAKTAKD